MSKQYRVFLKNRPLTKAITDPKRAQLAYSALYSAGESSALINDNEYEPEDLVVRDENDEAVDMKLDNEWFGGVLESNNYYNKVKHQALMEQYDQNGEMKVYSVISEGLDKEGEDEFVSPTYDKNKAVEVANFLRYGLDPDIRLQAVHYDAMCRHYSMVDIKADSISIVTLDGDVVESVLEPEWAEGEMNPDVITIEEDDFTAAVNSLSENQETEQSL